jgi:hypothetical protein
MPYYGSPARHYTRRRYSKSAANFPLQTPTLCLALPHQAYSPFRNRAALTGTEAVRQLANDLLDLAASHGRAAETDLLTLGWPKAALVEHGEAARTLAQRRN